MSRGCGLRFGEEVAEGGSRGVGDFDVVLSEYLGDGFG